MAGVKGRSGRKKSPTNAMKEALDYTISQLPELVITYTELCKDGKHKDLFQYLWDRVAGKPKQATEMEVSGGEEFTANFLVQLYTRMAAKRKELEGPVIEGEVIDESIQEQGTGEGI